MNYFLSLIKELMLSIVCLENIFQI